MVFTASLALWGDSVVAIETMGRIPRSLVYIFNLYSYDVLAGSLYSLQLAFHKFMGMEALEEYKPSFTKASQQRIFQAWV